MTPNPKLLPCPFCPDGGKPDRSIRYRQISTDHFKPAGFHAGCCRCGTETRACATPEEADLIWNTRHAAPGSSTWPVVLQFARKMEEELQANAHKGGRDNWKNDYPPDLVTRLRDEVCELEHEINDEGKPVDADLLKRIAKESANVANFAMFIADACGALDGEEKP